MEFTNSSLVTYKRISSKKNKNRKYDISRITPHCWVGQVTAKEGCDYFATTTREVSSNYIIGKDGSVGLCVDEKDRSWCSSSSDNDHRAVTIECASGTNYPEYTMNTAVYNKLIDLCVDICKRYGKTKLLWFGNKDKTLNYKPQSNEMVITIHKWFADKECPGNWLYSRLTSLASEVTKRLGNINSLDNKDDKKEESVKPSKGTNIEPGDTVKIKSGATYYSGKLIPSWVKNKTWIVSAVSGDRVVINKSADGKNAICSPIKAENLTVVKKSTGSFVTETFKPYTVQVSIGDLNIRKGPGTNFKRIGYIPIGVYTITAESDGIGASKWGKVKSGKGWISLDFVKRI